MRFLWVSVVLLVAVSGGQQAFADTLADLSKPSSTIAGCVNDWGLHGDRSGTGAASTCEGEAALAEWNEHAAAIDRARDTLVNASQWPDKADPKGVRDALAAAGDAADALTRLYHPAQPRMGDIADVLAWMRPWSERQHLPRPASIGDGFRSIATALDQPNVPRQDRNALYDQASIFAVRESQLATDLGRDVQRQTDIAVRAAHRAALVAAQTVEAGHTQPDAGAAIAAAGGVGHEALAQEQTRQLNQSLAAHSDQGGSIAQTGRALSDIPGDLLGLGGIVLVMLVLGFPRLAAGLGVLGAVERALLVLVAVPVSWLPLVLLHAVTGSPDGWVALLLWLGLFGLLLARGPRLLPGRLGRVWTALFTPARPTTHGSARFGQAATAARHRAPAAPADAFVLGTLRDVPPNTDRRFWQDGHILTCAPTGAGKGLGGVIPNLLAYPGSALVLDFKGENHAVTARARRALGQRVILVDPFGITGAPAQALNWLDTLDPDDPDVVSRAASLADMLVASEGADSDSHWNDTARELLRGLLVYVAGLPEERRSMAELRRLVTAARDDLADTLAAMIADPQRGFGLPARAATAHLNRPEKERGSVLSTVVRHTAWLDDPRLCAALARSDFHLSDLKRTPMTVYLALPPDRLRACLGFVRGFIGLALDAITAVPDRPAHRVAFFLDEFGQLGRMDRLADTITLLRGYGAQLWVFVQDLSQLKAVYPRWQSFLANTTQQFFGTADYDTARYLSGALGQQTVRFQTRSTSATHPGWGRRGSTSSSTGEHLQGRPLLTPDEVLRLGPTRPIVLVSGEAPYLLDRVSYLTDPAYAGQFDPNPMHLSRAAE